VRDVRIVFTKLSDDRHSVTVTRTDGTCDSIEVPIREYLRHDLAHFAIESELPIRKGFWGCVAAGASLRGEGVGGKDAAFAEGLAGPLQTLFRTDAGLDAYAQLLKAAALASGGPDLALRVHECIRRLRGRWKATPYGGQMKLTWLEDDRVGLEAQRDDLHPV
jgi:hypothetical protein